MIGLCKDLIITIIHNQYSLGRVLNLIEWILAGFEG